MDKFIFKKIKDQNSHYRLSLNSSLFLTGITGCIENLEWNGMEYKIFHGKHGM